LEIDGECKTLWFEVSSEYEKYLCYERSDAFLVGTLPWAMRNNHDITCVAPVTEELLYNLNHHLLPILSKTDKKCYPTRIIAPITSTVLENHGGVGTGMSCGVDSFHAVLSHYKTENESPSLTHLCINNTGSFEAGGNYIGYGVDKSRQEVYDRARKVAELLGLPLIESDSNIYDVFKIFVNAHTYTSIFAALCLQKLWKTYFFGSGFEYSDFSLENHLNKDTAWYDLLLLNCFSTRSLRFYSDGACKNRIEKTVFISDFPIVQKYLHVCHWKGYNCGVCRKCRRTMMQLDIYGKLDDFAESFPITYYRENFNSYLLWLAMSYIKNEAVCRSIWQAYLQGEHAEEFKRITKKRLSLINRTRAKKKKAPIALPACD